MSGLEIKIGVSDCDRMRPLVDGTVKLDNVAASFHLMPGERNGRARMPSVWMRNWRSSTNAAAKMARRK